jgi:hypothetical protein
MQPPLSQARKAHPTSNAVIAETFPDVIENQLFSAGFVDPNSTFSLAKLPTYFCWDLWRGLSWKNVGFTPKGERIALPMLGRLPVFPPPLDDQIEHGNKEQIQYR